MKIDKKTQTLTIENSNEIDPALVEILHATYKESKVGQTTIEKMNAKNVKYKVIVSQKLGTTEFDGEYGVLDGLTVPSDEYDATIFLFNTTEKFDGNFENKDQFDFVHPEEDRLLTDDEKKNVKGFNEENFHAAENHENTNKAIKGLSKEDSDVLNKINSKARTNKLFGFVTTLIHEFTHAEGNDTEVPAYNREIESYKQANP